MTYFLIGIGFVFTIIAMSLCLVNKGENERTSKKNDRKGQGK